MNDFSDPRRVVEIPAIEVCRIANNLKILAEASDGVFRSTLQSAWVDLLNITGVELGDYPEVAA